MKEPTLAQQKVLKFMDEGCSLFHRTGAFGGAWIVEPDLTCIPIRLQTFNGLLLRGLIENVGPIELYDGMFGAVEYVRTKSKHNQTKGDPGNDNHKD